MGEKKGYTESQKKATLKYLSKFIEMRVRVTPEFHSDIKQHLQKTGESTAAFMKRAIQETMERDQSSSDSTN